VIDSVFTILLGHLESSEAKFADVEDLRLNTGDKLGEVSFALLLIQALCPFSELQGMAASETQI
jgi:hypothetical protein